MLIVPFRIISSIRIAVSEVREEGWLGQGDRACHSRAEFGRGVVGSGNAWEEQMPLLTIDSWLADMCANSVAFPERPSASEQHGRHLGRSASTGCGCFWQVRQQFHVIVGSEWQDGRVVGSWVALVRTSVINGCPSLCIQYAVLMEDQHTLPECAYAAHLVAVSVQRQKGIAAGQVQSG